MPKKGLFGMRKFPNPFFRVNYPFFVAGAVMFYAIWKVEDIMLESPEFKYDPRNPKIEKVRAEEGLPNGK